MIFFEVPIFSFLVSIFGVLRNFSIPFILIKVEYLCLCLRANCLPFTVNYVFGLLFKHQFIDLSLLYFSELFVYKGDEPSVVYCNVFSQIAVFFTLLIVYFTRRSAHVFLRNPMYVFIAWRF